MCGEIERRICQLVSISRILKVEVDRWAGLGNRQSQRRLPDLARTEQRDGRLVFEVGTDLGFDAAIQHPRKLNAPR